MHSSPLPGSRTCLALRLAICAFLAIPGACAAQVGGPQGDARFDPAGIGGTLVLCGGGAIPDSVRDEFVTLAGGKEGRLVIIPAGSGDDTVESDAAAVAEIFKAHGIGHVAVLHTRSRERANEESFVAPLREATAVWITGGRQTQIVAVYTGTRVEDELRQLVARGGVVGGTSAGAACQSRVMLVRGRIYETPGLGLLPGAIVDQHFLARNRKPRLLAALEKHPDLVGFGVDEGTALIVKGRVLRCVGTSTVTICYGATANDPSHDQVLKPGETSDLTMHRRAARARTLAPFPPAEPAAIAVPQGALVIVGGGRVTDEIARRFIDLAGGDDAPIVVLPTASPDPLPDQPTDGRFLERLGAKNVQLLKERRRDQVESASFLDVLRQARGVWFGGGRQWRFVDAYEGTKALDAIRDVLRRGGVIGGSSAGATIQGEYLVRGSPLGNEQMMCPGYERGFAFLPGTAIDQHFTERNRFADLEAVVKAHPQLLGVGLDESSALVVERETAEVIGKGKAHFYVRRAPSGEESGEHDALASGQRYNLRMRHPLRDP